MLTIGDPPRDAGPAIDHEKGCRMRISLRSFGTLLVAFAVNGCALEAGSTDSVENVGSSSQAFTFTGTSLSGLGPHTVGTAVNVNFQFFQWTDLVDAASGKYNGFHGSDFVNPLASFDAVPFLYVSAVAPTHIRAIGVSQTDGKVYTWYDTNIVGGASSLGTWSRGNSLNLGGLNPFSPPAGLTISQLIEADMSSSGTWQFFWQTPQGVRRSLSTSPDSGGSLTAGFVQVLPNLTIAGIAIDRGNPNTVWTWYTNSSGSSGPVNMSTNAQDLAH